MGQGDIRRLLEIMAALRAPAGGCPWDREQDFSTIAPYTIEEAYEVAEAIEHQDMVALRDELGDLLFQVAFHARMAEEVGAFDFGDVVEAICQKMVRRHPHVFGDANVASAAQQSEAWEVHKAEERVRRYGEQSSLMDGVNTTLPALPRAAKLQRRAARAGFDWPDRQGVLAKLEEELRELKEATEQGGEAVARELGDVLFTVVNLARHLDVEPESALRQANGRFEARFRAMEALARERDSGLAGLDAAVLDDYWIMVKKRLGE